MSESKCLVCGAEMDLPKTVWCADCDTPHHRECFAYTGMCAIFGCGGMRFREEGRRGRATTWIEVTTDDGTVVPQGYVVEFHSFREIAAVVAMVVALAAAAIYVIGPARYHGARPWSPGGFGLAGLAFLASLMLYRNFDDYRIIDAKTRKVWMHRRLFNRVTLTVDAEFIDCLELVISYGDQKRDQWMRDWNAYLVLSDGSAIRLVDVYSERISSRRELPIVAPSLQDAANRIGQIVGLEPQIRAAWEPQRMR